MRSSAFTNNGQIPMEYTCDGAEVSPPLSWSKAPAGTKSIAILVEDPDAPSGTFTHWLITGIPANTTTLDKGAALPKGATAFKNDKGALGYAGPCPPSGTHHYRFHVYALDITPDKSIDTKAGLAQAMAGHILAEGELDGVYSHKEMKQPTGLPSNDDPTNRTPPKPDDNLVRPPNHNDAGTAIPPARDPSKQ